MTGFGTATSSGTRRRVVGLVYLAVAGVLIAAHLEVEQVGSGSEGLLLVADHLYNAVLAGAVAALCFATGDRLIDGIGSREFAPVDRLLVATPTGAGAIALAILVSGLAGILHAILIFALFVAAAAWSRDSLAELPALVARTAEEVPTPLVGIGVTVGLLLMVLGSAPPTDWDSLMYHLHLPEQFLEEGRIFLPSDTHHVAFVGLAHMLYVALLAFGGPSAPALFNVMLAMLLPLAVHRLGERLFGPATAEVSGVAVWGTSMLALVAVTARVDVTLVVFLTVAHLALHQGLEDGGDRRWLIVAALLLGLSAGVKYQAGGYILAVLPMVVWALAGGGPTPKAGGQELALSAAVLVGAAAPWFVKNWLLLDAPFYPFLAERQLPMWLAELHGSRVVPEDIGTAAFGALAEVRKPFSLLEGFLSPERFSPEREAAFYRVTPLLLLLPAWLVWIRDRKLAWVVVPGAAYVVMVLAASPRTNLRYLLPAIPPLTVAGSAVLVRVTREGLDRLGSAADEAGDGNPGRGSGSGRWARLRILVVGLAVASLVPSAGALRGWLPGEVSPEHLTGAESRMEYLGERQSPALVTRAGLTDFGERPPPEDARVLMMFEARELYFTVPALQDPLLTNWSLLAPLQGELDCLRDTDITHVLVGTGVLRYYFDRGLDPETVRWPDFRSFADRCLEQVLDVAGYVLFRVPTVAAENRSPARPDSAAITE